MTLIALCTATIIGNVVTDRDGPLSRILSWKPLQYLGRISYGMYLWHIFVLLALQGHVAFGHRVEFWVAAYAATVVVASVSYYGVERPFLRLKHRFETDRAEVRPSP